MAQERKICDDTIIDDIPTMDEFMIDSDTTSNFPVEDAISGAGNPDVSVPSCHTSSESEIPLISSIRLTLNDKTKNGDAIPYKWFSQGIAKQSFLVKIAIISTI